MDYSQLKKEIQSLLFQNQITGNARNDWVVMAQNRCVEFVFCMLEDFNKRFVSN